MNPQKHTWDTRAWLIGILGGSLSGSVTAWSTYPPLQKRLNALPHFSFIGSHSADVISGVSGIFGMLLLPGIISSVARRRTFLWGVLPLCLFLVFMEMEDWYENGIANVTKDLWIALLILGCCWVVSSGPVSFIRWQRVRAKHRAAAQLAAYQAMREAASVPQEGVWPPPPDYTA